ncbi:MAG: nucleotide exchange factor GrpE [Lactococcus lactis]
MEQIPEELLESPFANTSNELNKDSDDENRNLINLFLSSEERFKKFSQHFDEVSEKNRQAQNKTLKELNLVLNSFQSRIEESKNSIVENNKSLRALQESIENKVLLSFMDELLLILDRIEKRSEQNPIDSFAMSIRDELFQILQMKGLKVINVQIGDLFDPTKSRIIRNEGVQKSFEKFYVSKVERKGYSFNDRVIRYAEVLVQSNIADISNLENEGNNESYNQLL